MCDSHVGGCFSGLRCKSAGTQIHIDREDNEYKVVQLNGGDALVNTRDDLLRNSSSVDMVGVQAITQARNASCDLVELYALLAIVYSITKSAQYI